MFLFGLIIDNEVQNAKKDLVGSSLFLKRLKGAFIDGIVKGFELYAFPNLFLLWVKYSRNIIYIGSPYKEVMK